MKYLHLLWSNLRRRKVRTIFTILSILVAFVLFSYLAAIRTAFAFGIEVAGADRLLAINKVSLIQPLPIAYMNQIAATEAYYKAQGLFGPANADEIEYSDVLALDLSAITPNVAGPKRPQDRIALAELKAEFDTLLKKPTADGVYGKTASQIVE